MGYIGKSFALGSLGILGSIIAACGGGGVTDVVAADSTPSPYVLFASAFKQNPNGNPDSGVPHVQTLEGGLVYEFSDPVLTADDTGFELNWGTSRFWSDTVVPQDLINMRQAYSLQASHIGGVALSGQNTYFGAAIQAPAGGSVNISASENLVIQLGDELLDNPDFGGGSIKFTVTLSGGGDQKGAPTYAWPQSCNADVTVLNSDAQFNIGTYIVPLSSFADCDLTALKVDLREVAVKLVEGKNPDLDSKGTFTSGLHIRTVAFNK